MKKGTIDMAILTDSNQYIEYTLNFPLLHLSKYVLRRVRSLFEPYFIDKHSDIMVNDLLDEDHPLYQYFMALHQHIGFKLSTASLDRAVNRVHYFYYKKTASKSKFNKVWKRVIESKQCPWITQDVDYAVQNKGYTMATRIKTLRLAMFYIVVKNHLYRIKKRSISNKQNMSTDV